MIISHLVMDIVLKVSKTVFMLDKIHNCIEVKNLIQKSGLCYRREIITGLKLDVAPPSRNIFKAAPCSELFFTHIFKIRAALSIRVSHNPKLITNDIQNYICNGPSSQYTCIEKAISIPLQTTTNQGMRNEITHGCLSKSLMANSCENILLDSLFIAFDEEREIAASRRPTADGQHRFSFPSNASVVRSQSRANGTRVVWCEK